MKFVTGSIVSAGIMALSTTWAAAGPVRVLDYLNLRTGPGIVYPIIEIIPAGWTIDAGGCVAGWCQVNVNGIVGYADANFLGFGYGPVALAPAPVVVPGPVVAAPPPYPYYQPYAGYYYDSGYAYGGPAYPAPFGAYAEASDADVAVATRRAGRATVTRADRAEAPRHIATAQRRSPTGVRPVRLGQNPE